VFHEALVSTLLTIAEMAGQALERTTLSEAEHRLVTTLQDSVLVPLPAAAHLDIAARYLPASQDIGMGGDWYEGIALDEHHYALIIGDVAGHGITAVGDMAQLRAVIGALVRLGTPARHVFSQTTDLLQAAAHTPTASALLVILDTERCTLSYATAGHPPPLLRRPGDPTVVLDESRQPILGIPARDTRSSEVPFPPGSLLVAYTDGLIEERGEAIDVSLERLRVRVDGADLEQHADGLAEQLLQHGLRGREPNDDVALVIIRHQP
jgi:serine phosphatase RsbU (regulator of sigma subunit)